MPVDGREEAGRAEVMAVSGSSDLVTDRPGGGVSGALTVTRPQHHRITVRVTYAPTAPPSPPPSPRAVK